MHSATDGVTGSKYQALILVRPRPDTTSGLLIDFAEAVDYAQYVLDCPIASQLAGLEYMDALRASFPKLPRFTDPTKAAIAYHKARDEAYRLYKLNREYRPRQMRLRIDWWWRERKAWRICHAYKRLHRDLTKQQRKDRDKPARNARARAVRAEQELIRSIPAQPITPLF